ncbi:DMT family transporter [Skermanella rosea]|uniref:DMT family transporter n=1 Tax=Skermanella rosea TaxID=1817965 RepID=UPI001E566E8A|nr:DMT family transporter [Skermanella rosea]UEM01792.1 DMT family transporter [Skermanella rosea]
MTPRERNLRTVLSGFAWAAVTVTIFAGWFVVTRFGVTRELRVWDITALRFGFGTLILLPVLLGRAGRMPKGAWTEGLLFAALWGAPFVLLVAMGLQLTSAAQASSVTPTMMPVFSGAIAWLALRERPGRGRLAGYAAIIAGLVGLTVGASLSGASPSPAGFACLLLASAMWALYTLRFRRSGLAPIQAAALICFWSAVLFLPAYLAFDLARLGSAPIQEVVVQTVYQGVLMSAVAIVTFNRAVSLLGSGAATAIVALVPVMASLIAIPILGEIPTPIEGIAIAVIVVGVTLAARPPRAGAPA